MLADPDVLNKPYDNEIWNLLEESEAVAMPDNTPEEDN